MRKYKHLPTIVSAEQWNPGKSIHGLLVAMDGSACILKDGDTKLWLKRGDWVVRGLDGTLYPVPDAVFKNSYELIPESVEDAMPTERELAPAESEVEASAPEEELYGRLVVDPNSQ
jgi:hypothetical protein